MMMGVKRLRKVADRKKKIPQEENKRVHMFLRNPIIIMLSTRIEAVVLWQSYDKLNIALR